MSIPIFIGYDERESVAYHTFCQSIISNSKQPYSFTPLSGEQRDGSNSFIYARFLVPHLRNYKGWAIFADGDMVCQESIWNLWALRDEAYAVMVVQHDYKTKHPVKYLGAKNEDYPRKNWSSLVLWNCGHESNRILTPAYVEKASGAVLHRFSHLQDDEIGLLPTKWNWLVGEYPENNDAALLHYTIGTPCFEQYTDCDSAEAWHNYHAAVNRVDE
jgi:lipopolysaccharide biosynthesis glycosyltransferase